MSSIGSKGNYFDLLIYLFFRNLEEPIKELEKGIGFFEIDLNKLNKE